MKNQSLDKNMRIEQISDENISYFSVEELPHAVLEGLAFKEHIGCFRRLPEKTELFPYSDGVDVYANHSAGVSLRFCTDSADIRIKAKVRMTPNSGDIITIGRIGFDLYCGTPDKSFCVGVSKINFDAVSFPEYSFSARMYDRPNPNKVMHEFQLFFPLYAEVEEFQIGFEQNANFAVPSPRSNPKPIILYGTSIEQGCSASRPGMAYSNILSRKLNREIINLGFAGSAKGELFMAKQIAEITDPGAFILWYDSNVSADELAKTLPAFTDILRNAHRNTPIITISKLPYPNETPVDNFDSAMFEDRKKRTDIHAENMRRRINSGDARIHFIDGRKLLNGNVPDCFHDLVHPNDSGMEKIAENLAPRLAILAN